MAGAFVTGGSGFIGGRLIERLRAEGHAVRALARSPAAAERVRARGAEPVEGELADTDSMRTGADGCELAFHAAATLGDWGAPEEFERGNVEGTRNVLRACEQAGVRRLVHVSTEAVLLAGEPLVEVDEAAPLQPDSPALYSSTKARAEQAVVAADGDRLETVVVRPRFVWGVGDTTLLPLMVEMVRSGRFAWIGGGRHRTSTTHVDNTVEGLMLGAQRGRPGNVYFVTDGEPVVFREFVAELLASQGVAAPSRSVPAWAASALAHAGEAAWRRLPLPGRPPLTLFTYWVSSQECTIRIDKAREQLGYAPVKGTAAGLEELRAAHAPAAANPPPRDGSGGS
jgi:nucleoside-diphosphate-sugar epimerase